MRILRVVFKAQSTWVMPRPGGLFGHTRLRKEVKIKGGSEYWHRNTGWGDERSAFTNLAFYVDTWMDVKLQGWLDEVQINLQITFSSSFFREEDDMAHMLTNICFYVSKLKF